MKAEGFYKGLNSDGRPSHSPVRASPFWLNYYLYEFPQTQLSMLASVQFISACTPQQIQFHLCNKYKFTLQQILYHKYKIVQLLKGHGRMRTRFCGHTRGNSCYPPCYPGFWNNMKSELNVEDNHVTILSQTLQWYYWKISLLKWGSLYELGFLDPINILSQILQWYYWKINLLECGSIYGFGILMLVTVQLNILSQILQW